jgi:hypothetical protein
MSKAKLSLRSKEWITSLLYRIFVCHTPLEKCEVCEGRGDIMVRYIHGETEILTEITCDECDGLGVRNGC